MKHEQIHQQAKNVSGLTQAKRIQEQASSLGFDWQEPLPVFQKVREECTELQQAFESQNKHAQLDELGDLLFAVVNLSRHLNIDPEQALLYASNKFSARFSEVKTQAKQLGLDLKTAHESELDRLWETAKKKN